MKPLIQWSCRLKLTQNQNSLSFTPDQKLLEICIRMKFSLHSSSLTWWLYTCIKGKNPQWSAALNRGRGLRWRRSGSGVEEFLQCLEVVLVFERRSGCCTGVLWWRQSWPWSCSVVGQPHRFTLTCGHDLCGVNHVNNRNELLVSRVRLFLRDGVEEPLRWVRQEQDALRPPRLWRQSQLTSLSCLVVYCWGKSDSDWFDHINKTHVMFT